MPCFRRKIRGEPSKRSWGTTYDYDRVRSCQQARDTPEIQICPRYGDGREGRVELRGTRGRDLGEYPGEYLGDSPQGFTLFTDIEAALTYIGEELEKSPVNSPRTERNRREPRNVAERAITVSSCIRFGGSFGRLTLALL